VIPPLPPIGATTPPAAPAAPAGTAASGGQGFGDMLAGELGKLDGLQQNASNAAQQLATGQAKDVSSVAMEVERASLALQLAAQVRNKAVDAYQELFRMQV
jgi:flagellar hook-basal body complex protein FliE